jgi:capsular exopolysaccharide synthesis family protein
VASREAGKPETPPAKPDVVPALPRPAGQAANPTVLTPLPTAWKGAQAAPPPAVASAPDVAALLKALQRRWLLAASLCVLAGVGGLTAALLVIPAEYAVTASVLVSANSPNPITKNQNWRTDLFPTVIKTQAARLKSRDVLLGALKMDDVRPLSIIRHFPDTLSTLTWLEDKLKIDFTDGSEFITVSLNSDQPEEAVILINGITRSYLNLVNGKEKDERRAHVKKVQDLVKDATEKVEEKRTTLDGLVKGAGMPDSAAVIQKHQNLLQQLGAAQAEMFKQTVDLEKAQGKLAALKSVRKPADMNLIPEMYLERQMITDPLLKTKLDIMAALERAVISMKIAGHGDDEIMLMQTRKRLAASQKEVADQREILRKDIFGRHQDKADAEQAFFVAQAEQEVKPLESAVKRIGERVDELKQLADSMGFSTARLQSLATDIKQRELGLVDLKKSLQELVLEEAADFRISLGQEAGWLNQMPKKRLILLLMIPVAAVGAAGFGVAFLEFRARRIHSTDEVVAGLGMRVVGAVPALVRRGRHPALQAATAEHSHPLGESIDGIRTMLLRSAGADGTRVVMVTSAVSGEGKTTLASNLALSLARAGRRTLLVDCDLRRPAAHQLFEQTLQPGFSEVLLGEVELPDAVRPTTSDENLWLLPAGQWDREVLAELAKDQPEAIFERLRQEFDFVVVDSHPVLPATDSLLVGQHVDAVIVSVMRQVSQAPRVYEATQRLATLGIRIFGAVVNGMPNESYGGGYQYGQAGTRRTVAA